MKPQKKRFLFIGSVLVTVIGFVIAAAAQPSPVPTQSPSAPQAGASPAGAISPRAEKLLTEVCQTLSSANAFSFHAEVMFDKVLPSAVKVQFAGAIDFALQRPNALAIDYHSDLAQNSFGTMTKL